MKKSTPLASLSKSPVTVTLVIVGSFETGGDSVSCFGFSVCSFFEPMIALLFGEVIWFLFSFLSASSLLLILWLFSKAKTDATGEKIK